MKINHRYFIPIHLSDTTRMKYCGGRGSNTGTKNFTMCSSVANLLKDKIHIKH